MKRRLIFLTILATVVFAIWWEERPRPQTLVLTGTVDGNEVVVASKITGRIVSLAVDDGERVNAGDLVAVLDQDELRADQGAASHAIAQARANAQQSAVQTELLQGSLPTKVQQAAAQVEQTQAQLKQNESQVAQAQLQQSQAQVAQTQAAVAKAQDNFNRIRPLVEKDINPPQDLVSARADLDSATANQRAAEAGVEASRRAVAAAQAGVEATRRAVTAAQAALDDARQQERQVTVQQRQTDALRAAAAQAEANGAARRRAFRTDAHLCTGQRDRDPARRSPGRSGEPRNSYRHALPIEFHLGGCRCRGDIRRPDRHGQTLHVRLPSGTEVTGPVIYKAVEADFATQRDVSRTKRDIKTVAIRVRVANPMANYRWV